MIAGYAPEIGADLPPPADRVAGRTLGIENLSSLIDGAALCECWEQYNECDGKR